MGTITLSDKQQRRAEVLARLKAGGLSTEQASMLLGVTERQVRRQLACYVAEGLGSVVHGNTGRSPANKTPESILKKLRELAGSTETAKGRYHDWNTCHLQEVLGEREGIAIGRSTLDRLLCQAGMRKRRKGRPRRVFGRRERCGRSGDMLLTDASLHDWLEGRDARYRKLALLGAIDDATGHLVHLRFWPTECQAGYITMAREVSGTHGIPMSFYHDRHTILCSPKEQTIEDELAGREPMSQFQAILALLGAEPIKAMTPQAKGRIERLWRTLQDRLIKEMRLAGIATLEEANAFLPGFIARYNARFGQAARDPELAWVQAEDLDLPFYFAAKEERTVRADHTLSFMGQTLQIQRKRGERSLAGTRVMVHITPEGERFVYAGKERVVYTAVPAVAADPAVIKTAAGQARKPAQPPQHPRPTAKPSDNAGRRGWLYAAT
jgi:transposase